jgi:hypothetical protein
MASGEMMNPSFTVKLLPLGRFCRFQVPVRALPPAGSMIRSATVSSRLREPRLVHRDRYAERYPRESPGGRETVVLTATESAVGIRAEDAASPGSVGDRSRQAEVENAAIATASAAAALLWLLMMGEAPLR